MDSGIRLYPLMVFKTISIIYIYSFFLPKIKKKISKWGKSIGKILVGGGCS